MNPTLTTVLAIWGAALSTIVLLWDIRKWVRNNPCIVARVEFHEGFSEEGGGWISYEIRNRGGRPTTIEELMLADYNVVWPRWFLIYVVRRDLCVENVHVKHKDTVKLPVVLQSGEVWKGQSPVDKEQRRSFDGLDYETLIKAGKLYFKIRSAHSDRLISGKVKAEDLLRL